MGWAVVGAGGAVGAWLLWRWLGGGGETEEAEDWPTQLPSEEEATEAERTVVGADGAVRSLSDEVQRRRAARSRRGSAGTKTAAPAAPASSASARRLDRAEVRRRRSQRSARRQAEASARLSLRGAPDVSFPGQQDAEKPSAISAPEKDINQ